MKFTTKITSVFLCVILLLSPFSPSAEIFIKNIEAATTEDWLATAMYYDYIKKNYRIYDNKTTGSILNSTAAVSALIEDFDNDGAKEMLLFTPNSISLFAIENNRVTLCSKINESFIVYHTGECCMCVTYSSGVLRIYTFALSASGSVIVERWFSYTIKEKKICSISAFRQAFSRGHLYFSDDISGTTYNSETTLKKAIQAAGFDETEPHHTIFKNSDDFSLSPEKLNIKELQGNHVFSFHESEYAGGTLNKFLYDNTNLKKNIDFGILVSKPEMKYTVGDDILIGAYHSSNDVVDKNTSYSLSISNSSIAEFIKDQNNDGVTSFLLKAKSPGSLLVTIKELNSGVSRVIKLTVADNQNTVRCEDITADHYIKGNGIYIDNVKCTSINDKTHTISLDAYNFYYTYGIFEVYDEYGNFIKSEVIEPRTQYSGVKLFVESISCIGYDIFHKDEVFYRNPGCFAKTSITLKNIPNGSKIKYTNNSSLSDRLAFYNAVDIFISCLLETLTFSVDKESQKKTVAAFAKDLLSSLSDSAYKDLSASIAKSITMGSTEKTVESIYEAITNTCTKIGFDAGGYIKNTLKGLGYTVADSLVEIVVPSWKIAGMILSVTAILYKLNDLSYCSEHTIHNFYASHHNKNTKTLISNGVVAENEDGFTNEVLDVEIYNGSITIDLDSGEILNTVPYEIDIYTNGEKTDPKNPIEVMIPIPKGFDKENCGVLRQEDNGNFTHLDTEIKGDYLVFKTDHFSLYVLFEAKDKDQIKPSQKIVKGDINFDGKITAADARLALRASVRLEIFTEIQTLAADVDNTKGVSAADARIILRASVGLEKL